MVPTPGISPNQLKTDVSMKTDVSNLRKRQILIVDDHPIVRSGLRNLLNAEPDLAVCGEAEDAMQALDAIARVPPDLVLIDLSLQGMGGLDLTKQLHTQDPLLPILVVSMYEEHLYSERSIRAGACGYISKYESSDILLRKIRKALDDCKPSKTAQKGREAALNNSAANDQEDATEDTPISKLTDREFEVFLLIGQGLAPRHITERLNLSVNTVEVYRQRLRNKLNLESAAELTHYAVQWFRDNEE